MAEKHYVCSGDCGGESKEPGVCTTEGCSKHGQPLDSCECEHHNKWKNEEGEDKAVSENEHHEK